ncbi:MULTISPECIES: MarR family transcriptional regulator [unclassified Brevibacterium]|uniref:MarR family winged helix-turn-helix transcriptional regulator n=1 Tax=unclassified Brevibacterium TaxID=2614124 RepID=UPI001E33E41E|nr:MULTISPECIES: MarR family transcriptional regulator [unclassified Brevibacterium]MCD1286092.1 transcriptional regulator [Brevibacterium sp. CCUG 69071]MDK8433443.1 MarR family transcriptional regulator [Brevibacterium sp. H-BE7]
MSEQRNETTPVSSLIRRFGPIQIASWRLMMEKHQDFMAQFERGFGRRHGLTLNEFDTLINSDPEKPVRQRDLLRSMVLSRSALSRLLGRLEARGLVVQKPDPDDQRGVLVTLTEAGVQLRKEAEATNAEIIMAGFAGVSADEAEEIFALVSKIRPVPVADEAGKPGCNDAGKPDGRPVPGEEHSG